ncbi:MAG: acyl carrier protein [Lactobacillaceae bacterium]|jgi:acyl carrier protein|nr:acyl carrier protein [Lactobacillaceae bacterium]
MKKDKDQIYNELVDEISKRFDLSKDKITPNLNFITDVDADSIDFVELVLELEDMYQLEIPDEVAEKLITLQETVDYIYQNQGE